MEYFTKDELRKLFQVAYASNKLHHLCMVVGLWNGGRISEVLELTGKDVHNGLIYLERKKGSVSTRHPIHIDVDPLFDASPIIKLAKERGDNKLFPFSRQRADQFMKKYGELAGIHKDKNHYHSLKHSVSMLLWNETKDLGQLQNFLGHKAASSTLIYLRENDVTKAQKALENIRI